MEERFSVRWGIPLLDEGFTVVPNVVLDNYARLGLTPQEAMLIIHIARYKFERPYSEAYPSTALLAAQMGKSKRWVIELLHRLEAKGLIRIIRRDGLPSVYDLSPLAQRCLELSQSPLSETSPADFSAIPVHETSPVNSSSPPPVNSSSPPPVKSSSHEEEQYKNKRNNNNSGVVVSNQPSESKEKDLKRLAYQSLKARGISEETARHLAEEYPLQRILSVCVAADHSASVRDKAAWIIRALEGDWAVGARASHPYDNEEYRRMEGALRRGAYRIKDPITGQWIDPPGRKNGQAGP
jgi:DNA-binding MarR family transcriptional regulator